MVRAQRSCRERTVGKLLPVHDAFHEIVGERKTQPARWTLLPKLVVVRQVVDQRLESRRSPPAPSSSHCHGGAEGEREPSSLSATMTLGTISAVNPIASTAVACP